MRMRSLSTCVALAAAAIVTPVTALELTGLIVFSTDASGDNTGGYQNTLGGDFYSFNEYVLNGLPSTGSLGGSLLNSGNLAGPPTRIAIDLDAPGSYSFTAIADTAQGDTTFSANWGLNLFFGGNDVTPRISVFGLPNATGAAFFPSFATNSSPTSATLNPLLLGNATGSGSLSWSEGDLVVTLTGYRLSQSTVFSVDRVSGWELGANGVNDSVAEFTLSVTQVPEPSTYILMFAGLGLLAAGVARRRAR